MKIKSFLIVFFMSTLMNILMHRIVIGLFL